ncbi:MAG TPA: hypothetical protein VI893_07530, partial [Thermoplasmata archaeon]|nr:hypothetical protein [Thermoplasmata archaeon]
SFTIAATPPLDLTGVAAAWYKKDSVPTSPGDGTRTNVPFTTSVVTSGVHPLYLWAEDGVGNKDHNNRAQVDLRLDITPPAFFTFEIYEDDAWRSLSYWQHSNQTPYVRVTMSAGFSGLQVSSVQWRYSTDGGGSWSSLTGAGISMHTCAAMSGCPASDGVTGTLYAKIGSIPFNQDSGTENQFQIQARKMSGPATTTIVAPQTIKIDTIGPAFVVNTAVYSHSVNPLPAAWVDVDFNDPGSGLSTLQARFEGGGGQTPWYTIIASMGGVASYTSDFNLWTRAPVGTSTVRLRLTDLSNNMAENSAVTYEVVGESNALTLRLGTNFIGTKGTFTTPWGNLTIIQLGKEIFNATGRIASRVAVFASGAWIDVTSVDGVLYVGASGDRSINDGMGVLVKMTGAGAWPVSYSRSNRAITSPVNLALSNGFHFISVPEWTGGGTRTASQLGNAISLDAGAGCYSDITYTRCAYSVLKWNPSLNRYMEVTYGGEFDWTWTDTNFDADPSDGLMIKVTGVAGPGTFTFTP